VGENDVTININARDNASGQIKKVNLSLREMGEKIGTLGRSMTAAITVPAVGIIAGLTKMGADANKVVGDLNKELNDAMGERTKVLADQATAMKMVGPAAANAMTQANGAMDVANTRIVAAKMAITNLDPSVKSLAGSYNELQSALAPVKAQFMGIAADLASSLIPVLKDLMPTIKSVVDGIGGLVKSFAALPTDQKNMILGFVGIAAAIGPVMIGVQQVVLAIAAIQTLAPGLAAAGAVIGGGFTAMLGPIALAAAAVLALDQLMKKFVSENWFSEGLQSGAQVLTSFRGAGQYVLSGGNRQSMLDTMWQTSHDLGIKGYANGGNFTAGRPIMVGERGPEIINPGFSGSVSPMGTNITIIYQPAVALSSRDEAEQVLGPMIANYLHKAGR
jgi:hypothetical protein